jgi:hypothetical protein
LNLLDSGFHRNDGKAEELTFFGFIKVERFRVQNSGLKNSKPASIKGIQLLSVNIIFAPNG